MFDLSGRVAIVTGGSRGLGRAMALAFAQFGADVIVTSRKIAACEQVADEIRATTGRNAFPHACHVGHWQEIDALVAAAYEEFGCVDILVNNAGMSPTYASPVDITEELVDHVLAVNLKGPLRLTALVGHRMAEQRGGSIINISSTGAIRPRPHIIPYAAAKAGLGAMTEAFAHAYGPRVRVNTIMPGLFRTDVGQEWDMTQVAQRVSGFALGRIGEPSEIVGAAVYLASDAAAYVTGACIRVDGGT